MIQLAHLATGALAGRSCNGPVAALLAGIAMHGLGDITPHGEVDDVRFEEVTAVGGALAIALRHGFDAPVTWGAIGGVLPDLEHVLPKAIKPRRDIYPTHRYPMLHSSNGALAIPAWAQAILGGAVIGAIVAGRRRRRPSAERP